MTRDPDLRIAGLALWVHGPAFPDAATGRDAAALHVRAIAEAPGAYVELEGEWILTSNEVASFSQELEALHQTLVGAATLGLYERHLKVVLECDRRGSVTAKVDITPDLRAQAHRFCFMIDQSHLGPIISDCRRLLERASQTDPPS